jgi:hypothetical protein
MNGALEPDVLKVAVAQALNELLSSTRDTFETSKEWQYAYKEAYPEVSVL